MVDEEYVEWMFMLGGYSPLSSCGLFKSFNFVKHTARRVGISFTKNGINKS
jgi:hypothetical protein